MERANLVQAILALENGDEKPVEDPNLAWALSAEIKPDIDRLAVLKSTSDDQGENAPDRPPSEKDTKGSSSSKAPSPESNFNISGADQIPPLSALSPTEKARWIFLERFISLEKLESVLGLRFGSDLTATYQRQCDALLEMIWVLPIVAKALETNDLSAIQRLFASHVLFFRSAVLGDERGKPKLTSVETLRRFYPAYFYQRRKRPNWFENHSFFSDPLASPHWALCDTNYLNCTLRSSQRRLLAYAGKWELPAAAVRPKTITEDIYDRLICNESLEENLFATNCNARTATQYRNAPDSPLRTLFSVQEDLKITIHGKTGTPHWKLKKRLWPGVFPNVVLPPDPTL